MWVEEDVPQMALSKVFFFESFPHLSVHRASGYLALIVFILYY
jgi:hypothetical protein